jgi:hypothetical protein
MEQRQGASAQSMGDGDRERRGLGQFQSGWNVVCRMWTKAMPSETRPWIRSGQRSVAELRFSCSPGAGGGVTECPGKDRLRLPPAVCVCGRGTIPGWDSHFAVVADDTMG